MTRQAVMAFCAWLIGRRLQQHTLGILQGLDGAYVGRASWPLLGRLV